MARKRPPYLSDVIPAPKTGFKAVDWDQIDPQDPPKELIARYQNLLAAKKWAKAPLDRPLSDDKTRDYIMHLWSRHQERADAEAEMARAAHVAAKDAVLAARDDIQERLDRYLPLIFEPQPQDIVSLRQLCEIELQMEESRAALKTVPPTTEEHMKLRQMLTAEWEKLSVQYREFQKSLGITKGQRDAAKSDKSPAELVQEEIERAAIWMEREVITQVCPHCATEALWLWWAFARVHDPTPFYFTGRCRCGRVIEVGDRAEVLKAS